ncbi:hypothetical protein ACLKA6_017521 [Drosophila palustris]
MVGAGLSIDSMRDRRHHTAAASQQQHCAQPTGDRRNQQSAAIETRHSGRNTGRHTNITGTSSESVHAASLTHLYDPCASSAQSISLVPNSRTSSCSAQASPVSAAELFKFSDTAQLYHHSAAVPAN